MNDNDLSKLFEQTENHVIDPAAKRRAINAALAEFSAVEQDLKQSSKKTEEKKLESDKGFFNFLRPIQQMMMFVRRDEMQNQKKPWLLGSVATACVLAFAGYIAIKVPNQFNQPDNIHDGGSATEYRLEKEVISKVDDSAQPAVEEVEEVVITGVRQLTRNTELSEAEIVAHDIGVVENYAETQAQTLSRAARPFSATSAEADLLTAMKSVPATKKIMPMPQEPAVLPEVSSDRERFEETKTNPVKKASEEPVSTFSVDVDTSSYSFSRRKLNQGRLPEKDAVRVEEYLNYFDYAYPQMASKEVPFATHVMVGDSPWNTGNKLIHIGIKGYEIDTQPKSNLVFLLDVSGSMSAQDKLPLVKQSMGLLLDQLRPDDTVAIAVYAGAAGTVLEPTPVKEKQKILTALNQLNAGGSTAGAQGIKLAYQLAEQNFNKDAVNRIILATDGDFNVGISEPKKLEDFVERKREKGIYLSVLGFGQGNYYDHLMQSLAQNGNGVAAYIDTLGEAQKVLVHEATSSLFPIAKDVKIQVEFNPATVAEYRLIGYETRQLAREDFNNDKVDAGDIGAGHTVTAIYEITPVGSSSALYDESRYGKAKKASDAKENEYALLKLRYKLPNENTSKLIERVIDKKDLLQKNDSTSWKAQEFNYSAAVAGFAQLLKGGKYTGNWGYDEVINLALSARGEDIYGYRNEFVQLVRKAKIAQDM